MRVLLVGALGQLGSELAKVYASHDLVTADRDGGDRMLDITNLEALRAAVSALKPDLVLNAAAFHNVPECEEKPGLAFAVNATGARNLAVASRENGARLLHMSTDYVFGWGHSTPITEEVCPSPLSSYGASKIAGEYLVAAECPNHIIVRSAALYGPSPCRAKGGQNFVGLMLHLAKTRGEVKVVTDETTTPTYTVALAKQIELLARKGEPGTYHASCQGGCTWHEFAQAIFAITKAEVKLETATQEDFPSPVRRPPYSVLENARLKAQGIDVLPSWREALEAYLQRDGA